jgi:hypothetical protein
MRTYATNDEVVTSFDLEACQVYMTLTPGHFEVYITPRGLHAWSTGTNVLDWRITRSRISKYFKRGFAMVDLTGQLHDFLKNIDNQLRRSQEYHLNINPNVGFDNLERAMSSSSLDSSTCGISSLYGLGSNKTCENLSMSGGPQPHMLLFSFSNSGLSLPSLFYLIACTYIILTVDDAIGWFIWGANSFLDKFRGMY